VAINVIIGAYHVGINYCDLGCKHASLADIWNGEKRMAIIKKHIEGKRDQLAYCGHKCHFYGVPRGKD